MKPSSSRLPRCSRPLATTAVMLAATLLATLAATWPRAASAQTSYAPAPVVHVPKDPAVAAARKQMNKADRALARTVRHALRASHRVPVAHLVVLARDGVVTLTGYVPTDTQKADAGQIAGGVSGVTHVENPLAVGAPAP